MKKTITIEQLEELSEKGKERLREWITTDGYFGERDDAVLCVHLDENCPANNTIGWSVDSEFNNPEWWEKAYPLLSIGQMIEFLGDHLMIDCNGFIDVCYTQKNDWYAEAGYNDDGKYIGEAEELCDALWEAVKEILEEDDKERCGNNAGNGRK